MNRSRSYKKSKSKSRSKLLKKSRRNRRKSRSRKRSRRYDGGKRKFEGNLTQPSKRSKTYNKVEVNFGLYIKDTKINFISGPIFMTILKPKESFINKLKGHGLYAPIFILFGDDHSSDKNQCVCSEAESGTCLDMMHLLKKIDTLTTTEFPIDVFIEFFNMSNRTLKESNYPLNKLKYQAVNCFGKNEKKELQCPTRNIRWHYADVRFNDYKKEYNFEFFIDNLYEIFYKRINDKPVENMNFTKILTSFSKEKTQIYLNLLKTVCNSDFFSRFLEIENGGLTTKEFKKTTIQTEFVKIINKDIISLINNLIKYTNKFLDHELIITLDDMNTYINNFINLLSEYLTWERNVEEENKNYETFREVFKRLEYYGRIGKEYIEGTINFKKFIIFCNILLDLDVYMMDYYFLLRSLKTPYNKEEDKIENNAIMNISYFGSSHSIHIIDLLVNKLKGYDILLCVHNHVNKDVHIEENLCYKNPESFRENDITNEKYRCININKEIHLDQLLEEHKENYYGIHQNI